MRHACSAKAQTDGSTMSSQWEWRRPRSPNRRQQRGAIISQRSGIVDAAGIPVGQDVRGVGDVVEKFTGAPQVPG